MRSCLVFFFFFQSQISENMQTLLALALPLFRKVSHIPYPCSPHRRPCLSELQSSSPPPAPPCQPRRAVTSSPQGSASLAAVNHYCNGSYLNHGASEMSTKESLYCLLTFFATKNLVFKMFHITVLPSKCKAQDLYKVLLTNIRYLQGFHQSDAQSGATRGFTRYSQRRHC